MLGLVPLKSADLLSLAPRWARCQRTSRYQTTSSDVAPCWRRCGAVGWAPACRDRRAVKYSRGAHESYTPSRWSPECARRPCPKPRWASHAYRREISRWQPKVESGNSRWNVICLAYYTQPSVSYLPLHDNCTSPNSHHVGRWILLPALWDGCLYSDLSRYYCAWALVLVRVLSSQHLHPYQYWWHWHLLFKTKHIHNVSLYFLFIINPSQRMRVQLFTSSLSCRCRWQGGCLVRRSIESRSCHFNKSWEVLQACKRCSSLRVPLYSLLFIQ